MSIFTRVIHPQDGQCAAYYASSELAAKMKEVGHKSVQVAFAFFLSLLYLPVFFSLNSGN